jgi:hypothetical protein
VVSHAAGGSFLFRFVDYARVRGRSQPQRVYELLCPATESSHTMKVATLDAYQAAVHSYFAKDFLAARCAFEEILSRNPQDTVSSILSARCDRLARSEPAEGWNGAADSEEPL